MTSRQPVSPDIEVMELVGDFDLTNAGSLDDQLAISTDRGTGVIVDLGDCTFVDLAVLRVFEEGWRRARRAGTPFIVVLPFSAPPEVRLTMLHLGPHLAPYPVVPDRASAIASLVRTAREQLSTGSAAARLLELRAQMWESAKRRESLLRSRDLLILEQRSALRTRPGRSSASAD